MRFVYIALLIVLVISGFYFLLLQVFAENSGTIEKNESRSSASQVTDTRIANYYSVSEETNNDINRVAIVCSFCDELVKEGTVFCGNCGTQVNDLPDVKFAIVDSYSLDKISGDGYG